MGNYMIINNSKAMQFVDLDGKDSTPDDVITLGTKGREKVQLTDVRAKEIKEQFGNKLIVKKL